MVSLAWRLRRLRYGIDNFFVSRARGKQASPGAGEDVTKFLYSWRVTIYSTQNTYQTNFYCRVPGSMAMLIKGGGMLYFLDTDPHRAARLLADDDIRGTDAVGLLSALAKQMRIRVHCDSPPVAGELLRWVRGCRGNLDWAVAYVQEVMNEHLHRFGRLHSWAVQWSSVAEVVPLLRQRVPAQGSTLPPFVPTDGDGPSHIAFLLVPYVTRWQWFYGKKRRGATYTKRAVPEFIEEKRITRDRRREPRPGSHDRRHHTQPEGDQQHGTR